MTCFRKPRLEWLFIRIYLNTSTLNRPFDDQSAERVRLEAEAMAVLFAAVEAGTIEWIGSDYLEFEVSQNPNFEKKERVRVLLKFIKDGVKITPGIIESARQLEGSGLRGIDALHIASATAGRVELLVTSDDRMIKRARRIAAELPFQVVRPTEAVDLLQKEEDG